jgi:hypothetical protein
MAHLCTDAKCDAGYISFLKLNFHEWLCRGSSQKQKMAPFSAMSGTFRPSHYLVIAAQHCWLADTAIFAPEGVSLTDFELED